MVKVVLERSTTGLMTLVIMNYVVVSVPAEKGYIVITIGSPICVLVTT